MDSPHPPRAGAPLANAIARDANLSWETSGTVLHAIILLLRETLSAGHTLALPDFGTLSTRLTHRTMHVTFKPHPQFTARIPHKDSAA